AVLARLLEGSTAAPLLKEAAGSGRLAVAASAGFHLLEERGMLAFTIYPVSAAVLPAAGPGAAAALGEIRAGGVAEDGVRDTVKAMKLEAAVRRSTVGSMTQELAEAQLFGDVRYGWDAEANLGRVTSQDIRRVASGYLVPENCATLIVLPKQEAKPSQDDL